MGNLQAYNQGLEICNESKKKAFNVALSVIGNKEQANQAVKDCFKEYLEQCYYQGLPDNGAMAVFELVYQKALTVREENLAKLPKTEDVPFSKEAEGPAIENQAPKIPMEDTEEAVTGMPTVEEKEEENIPNEDSDCVVLAEKEEAEEVAEETTEDVADTFEDIIPEEEAQDFPAIEDVLMEDSLPQEETVTEDVAEDIPAEAIPIVEAETEALADEPQDVIEKIAEEVSAEEPEAEEKTLSEESAESVAEDADKREDTQEEIPEEKTDDADLPQEVSVTEAVEEATAEAEEKAEEAITEATDEVAETVSEEVAFLPNADAEKVEKKDEPVDKALEVDAIPSEETEGDGETAKEEDLLVSEKSLDVLRGTDETSEDIAETTADETAITEPKKKSNTKKIVLIIIFILLALIIIWLFIGIMINTGHIPSIDLGYSWFNDNIFHAFYIS